MHTPQLIDKDRILARYGGDEFLILLPNTNCQEAENLAKEINNKVKKEVFSDGEFSKMLTVSAGVSSYPYHKIEHKEQFVKFADVAMYKAKRSGRDKVCVYKRF